MNDHSDELASAKRDWVALLGPSLLAVVVTLALQIGGYVWFMATMAQRVTNVELRVKVNEDVVGRLPADYVPRAEHARNDAITQQQREEDLRRLDRIEAKLDVVLEKR